MKRKISMTIIYNKFFSSLTLVSYDRIFVLFHMLIMLYEENIIHFKYYLILHILRIGFINND